MKKKNHKYGSIFGITINGTRRSKVLKQIEFSLKKRTAKKIFISTPNPEILVEARNNLLLKDALNDSDIRVCDGTGVALALKLKGFRAHRIRGRQLMLDLFGIASKKKLKVYLLGATSKVNESSVNRVISEYPDIQAKGSSGPVLNHKAIPIDGKNERLEKSVVQEIKKFKPHILIVAFGAPKQEIWINKHKNNLPVRVILAAGGSLDFYSGKSSVPPDNVAKLGLEWLWRVVHEPKRIGRIIKAVFVFPILVVFDR